MFADWYHLDTIHKLRFFDDNTRSWWDAATGGRSPQFDCNTVLLRVPVCAGGEGQDEGRARGRPCCQHAQPTA